MTLSMLLQISAERHAHLCPRQVLGVRMGLLAGRLLGIDLPQEGKRVLTIVETDGCAADGIAVATGCSVGHRTLRVEDFGKVAATFVDSDRDCSVRVAPHPSARQLAAAYAREAPDRWHAQLLGYQRMPSARLFTWQTVALIAPVSTIVSRPDARAICGRCGEEVMNEREVRRGGEALCRACAGQAYYRPAPAVADGSGGRARGGPPRLSVHEAESSEGSYAGLVVVVDAPATTSASQAAPRPFVDSMPRARKPIEKDWP